MNKYLDNGKNFLWGDPKEPLNPGKTQLLDKYAKGRVLDIGCAVGRFSNYLAQSGHETVGIDSQEDFIKQAKLNFPKCVFRKASVYKLPFPDKSFDTVVIFDVLEHLDDDRAIQEAARVGKRLIISVPKTNQDFLTRHSVAHHHYMDMTHLRTYTTKSLKTKLKGMKVLLCQESLPISIYSLAVDYFAGNSALKTVALKAFLKLFKAKPILYSTVFAVADTK